jgi:exodeoxyribonuclease VII large subunit
MWQSDAARLKFQPGDGLEVIAGGAIEVFDRAGRYHLYVRRIDPRGAGSLELAFRQLYEKLEREGLFDPRRKKPIPRFPRRIGIITSPTGAAIADVLRTIAHRFPCVSVLVFPVRVQGPGAAGEIADALRLANACAAQVGGIDVLIVGRGGGSLEDLWAFNEEAVARAVYASGIPVLSGVGHEVDTTICDLVADARAATPTAAAQMAVPVLDDVMHDLAMREARFWRGITVRWEAAGRGLGAMAKRNAFRDGLAPVRARGQTLDLFDHRLHRALTNRHLALLGRMERLERLIHRIQPAAAIQGHAARLSRLDREVRDAWQRRFALRLRNVEAITRRIDRLSPLVAVLRDGEKIAHLRHRLATGSARALAASLGRLQAAAGLLQAVGHERVIERGYAITRTADGRLVRSIADAPAGVELVTQVRDGRIRSVVSPPPDEPPDCEPKPD